MRYATKAELFPDRLRGARLRQGLNQEALARELGVSKGAVGNWEVGTNVPGPASLRKISELLKVSVDFLLGGGTAKAMYPSPAGTEIRARIYNHVDRMIERYGDDLDRLTWAYVELARTFPLNDSPGVGIPGAPGAAAEARQWSDAAEKALDLEAKSRKTSKRASR
jgi:transcriptional regulator with XRE-family HTH domain